MIAIGIAAILFGAVLARGNEAFWNCIFQFFGSRTAMTATMLWLVVGIYGNILKEGQMVEGLVWAASRLHIGSTGFTIAVFLFSGLFAIATGSGFGTISAMSLTLFPAGVVLGGEPALLGGAILSGAALGDSIAPVSDTAVIAASSQQYTDGSVADIGGTVKNRLPIVGIAVALAIIAFFIVGTVNEGAISANPTTSGDAHPLGLAMLIPTIVVIVLSFRKVDIFISLAIGNALAIAIGLCLGLFTPYNLLNIDNGHMGGAIIDGVGGMANICILLMVVVALSGLIIRSGCMDDIVGWLNVHFVRSERSAELIIFSLVAIAGILVAAVNTIANICIAPFVNSIGLKNNIHPYRRATILATVICTFPFILPYGGCALLLQKGIEASLCSVDIGAANVMTSAFYPWALLCTTLLSCLLKRK
ncbi:MAG: hypothetical protein J6Y82_10895 [Bacteroidales bacterium]|nr:hypothetical protein [Bacteroidales bacterium]